MSLGNIPQSQRRIVTCNYVTRSERKLPLRTHQVEGGKYESNLYSETLRVYNTQGQI